MTKKLVISLLKYSLAVALLAYVVWSNWAPANGTPGLKDAWERHVLRGEPIQYAFLALATVFAIAAILITFIRWYILVRAVELPFTLRNALGLGAVGFFFNIFLPGSVGGDLVKAAFLAREQSRRTVAVATVIMDRVIALWALIWFVAICGGIFWTFGLLEASVRRTSEQIIVTAMITVAVTLGLWFLLGLLPQWRADRFARRLEGIPKVGGSLAELWRAFWMYRCKTRAVATVMALSWIGHVGFVLTYYCCVRTLVDPDQLGDIPALSEHFLLVPIGLVIQAIPLVPGGYGLGELGFGALYKWFGCASGKAVMGMLVQRVIFWVLGVLGYVVYLQMKPALQPVPGQKAAELATANA